MSEELLQAVSPERLFALAVVIAVTVFVSRIVGRVLDRGADRWSRHRLAFKKVNAIAKFVIVILGTVVAFTSVIRLSQEALVALGGVFAVAVGFAFKDLASSIIAGIIILLDRPFMVGDRVQAGSYYGEITEIGLRSVRLVTLDDNVVSIPNNKFLTDEVASGNWGALDMMIVISFHVDARADFMLAKKLIREAVITSKYVYLDKPVAIVIEEVLIPAIGIVLKLNAKAYVFDCRYEKAFLTEVTERVHKVFREVGINPPTILEVA